MKELKKICDELMATKSWGTKKKILRREQYNPKWTDFLYYLLKPGITTGLRRWKLDNWRSDIEVAEALPFCTGEGNDLIEYMSFVNKGNKKDVRVIWATLNQYDSELQEFGIRAILRELKLGVRADLVNMVYGDEFLPVLNYMRSYNYFDNVDAVGKRMFTITPKLNGMRCIAFKEGGLVTLYGANSLIFTNLECIEQEIMDMPVEDIILDGELLYNGNELLTNSERRKKTSSGIMSIDQVTTLTFHVFDVITPKEYNNKMGTVLYKDRRGFLDGVLADMETEHVKVVSAFYIGNQRKYVKQWLKEATDMGYEGIMININNEPYKFARTTSLLKVKNIFEADLMIVDYDIGYDGHDDWLNTFTVDYKGVKCKVPVGYTAEQRYVYGGDTDQYLGRVITVQYLGVSNSTGGMISPVFVELRDIGKKISYN